MGTVPDARVLVGIHGGLRWEVWAGGDLDDLGTMLRVFDGDRLVAHSGFRGPALPPGALINEWRGRTGRLPYFVMARAAPEVTRVVAVSSAGTETELILGPPDERFALRFAATGLPDGEEPAALRYELPDRTVELAAPAPPDPRFPPPG